MASRPVRNLTKMMNPRPWIHPLRLSAKEQQHVVGDVSTLSNCLVLLLSTIRNACVYVADTYKIMRVVYACICSAEIP